MPSEAGIGYQSPPEIPLLDPTPIQKQDRTRSIEDYVSRRIKARVRKTTPANVAPISFYAPLFNTVEYDTSGLWTGTGFLIPDGAEGDYTVTHTAEVGAVCPYTTTNDLGAVAWVSVNHVDGTTEFSKSGGYYDNLSCGTIVLQSVFDTSVRPGDSITAQLFNAATGVTLKYYPDNSYFSVRRLL